ncbi:MAG: MFS transporter [Deltaproteobacteria bacterium]|jgi:MFS family permease|nr:MFS transporter [Deltaproteobacteria bacterium]
MEDGKIWTKNFVLTTVVGFFSALVFYMSLTTLAVYAILGYGATESVSGMAASVFLLGSVFGRAFCGRYLELMGRRRTVLGGGLGFAAVSSLFLLPLGLPAFVVLRLVHGLVFGLLQNVLQTVVIQFIPKKRLGEGLSYFSLNFISAAGIGPFVALPVVGRFSYGTFFQLLTVLSVIPLVLSFFIDVKEPAFTKEEKKSFRAPFKLSDVVDAGALPMAAMAVFVGACYTSETTFLEAYARELGLLGWAGSFFIVLALVVIAVRPLAGKILDRRGENMVMYPSFLCFIISLVALSLAGSGPLLLVSAVFLALGFGNVLIMGQTVAVKSVPPHRTAKANATYFCFSDLGYGLGPILFGLIAAERGFPAMYLAGALVMAGTAVLYHLVHGRGARSQKA